MEYRKFYIGQKVIPSPELLKEYKNWENLKAIEAAKKFIRFGEGTVIDIIYYNGKPHNHRIRYADGSEKDFFTNFLIAKPNNLIDIE